ncbi:secreted protein [gut metagenome]|uniref:Secreted protein n=1 Tax=gut metagenome TaxID=749906 RepID=J9FZP7_9ZZZZ
MPQAFAVMIPAMVLRIIASILSAAEVPVVFAMNICLPLPGVTTRPTVETPIGNG